MGRIFYSSFTMSLILLSGVCCAEEATIGSQIYQPCAACHLRTGEGVPGLFPPVNQRLGPLVATASGRDYLIMVINNGLMGPIDVEGVVYQGVMPAQGMRLENKDIAAVLNHLIETFNATSVPPNWKMFTPTEVGRVKKRHPAIRNAELHKLRQQAFSK